MQHCRRASCWLCLSLGAPEDVQNHTYSSTGRRTAAAAHVWRRRRPAGWLANCGCSCAYPSPSPTQSLRFKLVRSAAQTQTACQSAADGCLGAGCVPDLDAVAAQARRARRRVIGCCRGGLHSRRRRRHGLNAAKGWEVATAWTKRGGTRWQLLLSHMLLNHRGRAQAHPTPMRAQKSERGR